jgi:hypothetical protein
MAKVGRQFSTGDAGWGIYITSGDDKVEIAVTGPQGGHYAGDWMTPEEAEQIALGLVRAAQKAREKATQVKLSQPRAIYFP